jgi:SpoVK/Ycf46/Vps4 family AAA+-type ATPase
VRFPASNSDKVIEEIRKFWGSKEIFIKHKMPYKRGICLWGPPGSGKSCTIKFVMKDVIEMGGIVIKFENPHIFIDGYRVFREIQSDTPVVVLMEDIDSTLEIWDESQVLDILDGVHNVENTVFLATTNYPEKLGARVINRPSRFDKRFKIEIPGEEARRIYLQHICSNNGVSIDVNEWVTDTDGFSIAHLKELYVAVIILGNDYGESLTLLKEMEEKISSANDFGGKIGFE